MNSATIILVLAVFGASCVEAVEALTLIVAAGTSRSWRSAFEGAATAFAVLVVLVAAIGVPLIHYVPIDVLRVVIGALLLVLGLGWLRKSILRSSGHKAMHDEDLIYANTVAELSAVDKPKSKRDAIAFTVAFKGVILEGTEVVLIVLSLGATQHRLGLAAAAAGAAILVVTGLGILLARQLREVPENTLKLGVGIMLSSFGLFWIGEGLGFDWPGRDLAILALIGIFVVVTAGSIRWLSNIGSPTNDTTSTNSSIPSDPEPLMGTIGRWLRSFGRFWWEFLIGENPDAFIGTLIIIGVALLLRHHRAVVIPLVTGLAIVFLVASAYRGRQRA